jgi:hypothetical protein
MRSWTALCLFLALPAAPSRADDPRLLIERALKALGGAEQLRNLPASSLQVKGSLLVRDDGVPAGYTIAGHIHRQTVEQAGAAVQLSMSGKSIQAVARPGNWSAWKKLDERSEWEKLSDKDSKVYSFLGGVYQARILALAPLLEDPSFTLSPAEPIQVEGRPARGLKVCFSGQPEAILYFDQQTGLPCRYQQRIKLPGHDREEDYVVTLADYHDLDTLRPVEETLRKAGLEVAPEPVVEFLKNQTLDRAQLQQARRLIKQLGHDEFWQREQASCGLARMGTLVLPLLKDASKDIDLEVARRAADCVTMIQERNNQVVQGAAIQWLALRQPAGSAEVLLALLPAAEDALKLEIRTALVRIGQRKGLTDQALVQALADGDPIRRSAAEAALGKDGGAFLNQPGRRLYPTALKQPRRLVYQVGNVVTAEFEVVDVKFFNRIDERVFSQPE